MTWVQVFKALFCWWISPADIQREIEDAAAAGARVEGTGGRLDQAETLDERNARLAARRERRRQQREALAASEDSASLGVTWSEVPIDVGPGSAPSYNSSPGSDFPF